MYTLCARMGNSINDCAICNAWSVRVRIHLLLLALRTQSVVLLTVSLPCALHDARGVPVYHFNLHKKNMNASLHDTLAEKFSIEFSYKLFN